MRADEKLERITFLREELRQIEIHLEQSREAVKFYERRKVELELALKVLGSSDAAQ